MSFSCNLTSVLAEKHLLKHPFYQEWSEGKLDIPTLQSYSRQYFHHVDQFPRYISAVHSLCEDLPSRQTLLRNLDDEEHGEENHPELWLRFAEGLGETRENVKNQRLNPETKNLIDTFWRLCRSSYEEGLGALFAYEQQVPEVAASKIEGLKKFYGIENPETIKFFEVHLEADVWHREAAAVLMDQLSPEKQEKAQRAAKEVANALWGFLDGVQKNVA